MRYLIIALLLATAGILTVTSQTANRAQRTSTQTSTHTMSKPAGDDLKQKLTPEQYYVTCQNGTEPPFRNAYWNNHAEGIYVDVISGEPLFSSKDKFDSGTGWPSFSRPLEQKSVVEKKDRTFGMVRVEVRGAKSDGHLGHLFDDGPKPSGLRYCLNSASLRFIPTEKLAEEGYGEYLKLFRDN